MVVPITVCRFKVVWFNGVLCTEERVGGRKTGELEGVMRSDEAALHLALNELFAITIGSAVGFGHEGSRSLS